MYILYIYIHFQYYIQTQHDTGTSLSLVSVLKIVFLVTKTSIVTEFDRWFW